MRRILGVLACAAAAVAGCSDQGPVAGELSVRLATSRTTDRAVLFQVVGVEHGVTPGTGTSYRILSDTSAAGDTSWIAVIAPKGTGLAAGEIARIAVPDTRKAGTYQISLTEVAAADYSVGTFPGVTLTVVKP
ncbi:MAG: hypothetical protein ABSG61_06080 [Gemmatimonadales bacterium]